MSAYAKSASVYGWGSDKNARRVSGLTAEERALVEGGGELRIAGCPPAIAGRSGTTERVVVKIGPRFYTRVPSQ